MSDSLNAVLGVTSLADRTDTHSPSSTRGLTLARPGQVAQVANGARTIRAALLPTLCLRGDGGQNHPRLPFRGVWGVCARKLLPTARAMLAFALRGVRGGLIWARATLASITGNRFGVSTAGATFLVKHDTMTLRPPGANAQDPDGVGGRCARHHFADAPTGVWGPPGRVLCPAPGARQVALLRNARENGSRKQQPVTTMLVITTSRWQGRSDSTPPPVLDDRQHGRAQRRGERRPRRDHRR